MKRLFMVLILALVLVSSNNAMAGYWDVTEVWNGDYTPSGDIGQAEGGYFHATDDEKQLGATAYVIVRDDDVTLQIVAWSSVTVNFTWVPDDPSDVSPAGTLHYHYDISGRFDSAGFVSMGLDGVATSCASSGGGDSENRTVASLEGSGYCLKDWNPNSICSADWDYDVEGGELDLTEEDVYLSEGSSGAANWDASSNGWWHVTGYDGELSVSEGEDFSITFGVSASARAHMNYFVGYGEASASAAASGSYGYDFEED